MAILGVNDLVYLKWPILTDASPAHRATADAAIVITAMQQGAKSHIISQFMPVNASRPIEDRAACPPPSPIEHASGLNCFSPFERSEPALICNDWNVWNGAISVMNDLNGAKRLNAWNVLNGFHF